MQTLITGKKLIDYVNKNGKKVEGYKIFCLSFSKGVEGFASGAYYIPKSNKKLYDIVNNLSYIDNTYDIVEMSFSVDIESQTSVLDDIHWCESRKWENDWYSIL